MVCRGEVLPMGISTAPRPKAKEPSVTHGLLVYRKEDRQSWRFPGMKPILPSWLTWLLTNRVPARSSRWGTKSFSTEMWGVLWLDWDYDWVMSWSGGPAGPCSPKIPKATARLGVEEPWVIWMGWKKRSSSVTVPSSKWDRHASLLESIMQPTTLTPKAAWPWISQNPGSRHVSFPACDSAHNPVEPSHWASSISEWCAVGSWPTPGAKIEPEVLTTNAMQLLGGLHPAR